MVGVVGVYWWSLVENTSALYHWLLIGSAVAPLWLCIGSEEPHYPRPPRIRWRLLEGGGVSLQYIRKKKYSNELLPQNATHLLVGGERVGGWIIRLCGANREPKRSLYGANTKPTVQCGAMAFNGSPGGGCIARGPFGPPRGSWGLQRGVARGAPHGPGPASLPAIIRQSANLGFGLGRRMGKRKGARRPLGFIGP